KKENFVYLAPTHQLWAGPRLSALDTHAIWREQEGCVTVGKTREIQQVLIPQGGVRRDMARLDEGNAWRGALHLLHEALAPGLIALGKRDIRWHVGSSGLFGKTDN